VIRTATADDLPLAEELLRAFAREVPDKPWRDDDTDADVAELRDAIENDVVVVSDDGAGFAVGSMIGRKAAFLDVVYVRPEARGGGLARELVGAVATELRSRGAEALELEVLASNTQARAIYERWGFATAELTLAAPIDALVGRLAGSDAGPTFGTIHVQTDDAGAVERAVQKAVPRFGRSQKTEVTGPANGWVGVHDELASRDPDVLQRLAKELSYTNGGVVLALGVEEGAIVRYTLFDRGSMVDEYASVPEYRGALPPGDVIALGANPTVVARLTGADPHRVREIARTASSPAELPPATELHAQIAELMGVEI
jgi:ribosomal protein S18 acetylase RimI-like enzyme